MIKVIKNLVASSKELLTIYPWIKLTLASVVGILGGSSFITFINKYAIYNYSVSYGGRLPAEGVPYIDVAISILSFAFFSISLISVLMIYGLLTVVSNFIHNNFKNVSNITAKIMSGLITSIIGALGSLIWTLISKGFEGGAFNFDILITLFFVVFVGVLLASLIIWHFLIRPFALLSSIGLVLMVSISLFNAQNYSSFLREIQYGGGVPATVVFNSKEEISGYLFLTTKTTSILWVSKKNEYIEIPVASIEKVRFHESEEFQLPEIKGSIFSLFKHLWL